VRKSHKRETMCEPHTMNDSAACTVADRRRRADRRARPTTFWGALRPGGRRKAFRRSEEGRNAYVDCPSRRALALVCFVVAASAFDALFTLLFIQDGGREANPLMAMLIDRGETPFVWMKMALTGLGAWFLAAHQYFPIAFKGLHLLAGGYVGLLIVHAVILLS
jgi:hypothetical protein